MVCPDSLSSCSRSIFPVGARRDGAALGKRRSAASSAALAFLLIFHLPVAATDITVGAGCTLQQAIAAANTDSAVGSCPAGSGADNVYLNGSVLLTVADNSTDGANGLPSITTDITVFGGGHDIERGNGSPSFRILHVAATGTLELRDTRVLKGSISGVTQAKGGGIFNRGTLVLKNSTVSFSGAYGKPPSGYYPGRAYGGGIYSASGSVSLTNSTVSQNTASGSYLTAGSSTAKGGGIFVQAGSLTLENTTLSSNTVSAVSKSDSYYPGYDSAYAGGGGLLARDGAITLVNVTVSGNSVTATADGEAEASGGGVLRHGFSTVSIQQSTFSGNSVSASGGSTQVEGAAVSGPVNPVSGTLFVNPIGATNCISFSPTWDAGGNLADDNSCATIPDTLTGVDATLQDNGGPTLTHALLAGSTAIDNAGACGVATDQRGAARKGDCDTGAFEYGGCLTLHLQDDTVLVPRLREACSILVGPNYAVMAPGDLILRHGIQTVLDDGFEVGLDAKLTVEGDPSLVP